MNNDYYNWVPELGEQDYNEQEAALASVEWEDCWNKQESKVGELQEVV